MTKEEAREVLLRGEQLEGDSWTFTEHYMSCWDPGCCDDEFNNVEEALSRIEFLCNGFKDVEIS